MADTVTTIDHPGALAANSLLSTKLFIPQARYLHDVLPRPRLVERLQRGLSRKLTLISAPAGYGKTILLTEWIPQSERCVCWLSLDETDNDLTRFLTYFIAALQMLKADFGQALLVMLQSPQLPPIESLMTTLLNEIILLSEFALVLDDYHLIHLPAIHTAIAFLLNHLPSNMHLILTSRADPPLPLARLRGRGQMSELRAADLRFTQDEATVFFHQIKRIALTAEQIEELATRTEGWGAGLQLAALSLRGLGVASIGPFIRDFTGSHHDVFDYLAEDVLQQQPAEVQRFLLFTSIVSRLCGPLCDAILGGGSEEQGSEPPPSIGSGSAGRSPVAGQELLEYLEHANLFLVPLDNRRRWYRYHHLFADFLHDRLTRENGLAEVHELYRRASGWFEQQGLFDEAIDCALLAHDFECAARLVDGHSENVRMHGELATLLRWLSALPDAAFEHRPTLALNHAFILALLDQFEAAERRLDAAEYALHAAPVRNVELLGQAAVVRAAITLQTDRPVELTLTAAHRALKLLPQSSADWRGLAGLFLGVGYYVQAGNLTAGYQALVEAVQASLGAGDPFSAANTFAHLSILLEISGQLRESERLNRENQQRAAEPFWQGVPLAAYAGFGLSRMLYERNDLLAAHDLLTVAIQQLEAWALKRPTVVASVVLARVLQALGEPARAREVIDRVMMIVQKDDLKQTFSQWAEYRARIALAQGHLAAAAQWAQEVEPTTRGDLNPALEFTHITLAQIYLAQQRLDDAQRLLDRLLPAAQAAGRMGRVLEIYLLQALTADAQGQRAAAMNTLERALSLAEPEGYIRTFVDLGPPMATLLREAQARAIQPAYVAKLLTAFPDFRLGILDFGLSPRPIPNPKSGVPPGPQNLIEPLSKRELEILHLIAQGYTNPEIGQQVFISDQTVKVHTRNIYGKLGVNSRRKAVAKARSLGLIT